MSKIEEAEGERRQQQIAKMQKKKVWKMKDWKRLRTHDVITELSGEDVRLEHLNHLKEFIFYEASFSKRLQNQ